MHTYMYIYTPERGRRSGLGSRKRQGRNSKTSPSSPDPAETSVDKARTSIQNPFLSRIGQKFLFFLFHSGSIFENVSILTRSGRNICSKGLGFRIQSYRGTSLTRKRIPLGPFRRPMPRVVGGS